MDPVLSDSVCGFQGLSQYNIYYIYIHTHAYNSTYNTTQALDPTCNSMEITVILCYVQVDILESKMLQLHRHSHSNSVILI